MKHILIINAGPLFGFHHMNAFASLEKMESFHFYDVEKNANVERDIDAYRKHLEQVFEPELIKECTSSI